MNASHLEARHFATGQPVRLRWEGQRIVDCTPIDRLQPPGETSWLAPALVDLQVNGYAGVDFQQDDLTEVDLLNAARGLARDGCTRWLLTLITDDWDRLLERLRHLHRLRQQSPALQHAIAGWHVEGPFLSAEPGFRGAHDSSFMIDPSPDHVAAIRAVTGHDPVMLTLAPERPGALAAIQAAARLGLIVSLGHTDASAECLAAAVRAGARAFTHLGNGCPRTLDRHDNILWRALDTHPVRDLMFGLIPDAIHVSGPLFRLLHRLLPSDGCFYVSDAMSAAGSPPGRYPLGRMRLEVGADQVVRLPGQPNFAGSALRPVEGVRRASFLLDAPWAECWTRFSMAPARLMGLTGGLESGAPADFCVVHSSDGKTLGPVRTWVRGEPA